MLKREELTSGVYWNQIEGDKFKTSSLLVSFILPLHEENVCQNAILPLMLRNGYKDCPDIIEFNKKLTGLYGAEVNTEIKKVADYHVLSIGVTSLKNEFTFKNEKIEQKAADLLISLITSPIFNSNGGFEDQLVAQQKQVLSDIICSEINDKRVYAKNNCSRLMFEGTRCGIMPYGTLDGVYGLSSDDITRAYFKMLKESRVEIICMEGKSLQSKKECFREVFAKIGSKERQDLEPKIWNFRSEKKEEVEEMDVAQAKLVIGFIGKPSKSDLSFAAAKLMTTIYGQSPVSKLFINIRERQSYCYYCVAQHDGFTGSIQVDSGVDEKNVKEVASGIAFEFEKMKNGEFSREEFERGRLYLKNNIRAMSDSVSELSLWYQLKLLGGTKISPEEFCKLIDTIKPEDVVSKAQEFNITTNYVLKGRK